MKRLLVMFVALVGCGDVASDPVEVHESVLIAVKPTEKPGLWVSCSLDGKVCSCTMSECGAAALAAAGAECARLRNPIVVE